MLLTQRPGGIPGINLESGAQFYGYTLLLTAGSYIVMRRLCASPFGATLSGIRVNTERMQAMGYRANGYKLAVFIVAGVFAGIAGHAFACSQFFIDPTSLHWAASGQVLMMVVLGGEGTLLGPAFGALLFRGLEEGISRYTQHWMLPMGLILVALVLTGRGGLARLARVAISALRAVTRAKRELNRNG
jgi:branched-chain amino acid transport system permease protein